MEDFLKDWTLKSVSWLRCSIRINSPPSKSLEGNLSPLPWSSSMALNLNTMKIIMKIFMGHCLEKQDCTLPGREIQLFLMLSCRILQYPINIMLWSQVDKPWFDVQIQCSSRLFLPSSPHRWWWSMIRCAWRWQCTCVLHQGWSKHPWVLTLYFMWIYWKVASLSGHRRQSHIISWLENMLQWRIWRWWPWTWNPLIVCTFIGHCWDHISEDVGIIWWLIFWWFDSWRAVPVRRRWNLALISKSLTIY